MLDLPFYLLYNSGANNAGARVTTKYAIVAELADAQD